LVTDTRDGEIRVRLRDAGIMNLAHHVVEEVLSPVLVDGQLARSDAPQASQSEGQNHHGHYTDARPSHRLLLDRLTDHGVLDAESPIRASAQHSRRPTDESICISSDCYWEELPNGTGRCSADRSGVKGRRSGGRVNP